jgi:putative phage-type endonuclease
MSIDHEARRHRIGASEIAAILGLNEYMSPLDVWLVKTGRKPPFEGNEHTRRGNRQEAQILAWLGEELGKSVLHPCPSIDHKGGLASATPDGFVLLPNEPIYIEGWSNESRDPQARCKAFWGIFKKGTPLFDLQLAEAKSTLKPFRYNGGTPDFREREISDVPNFWVQCQWQMMCTGIKTCHLAIFGPRVSDYQRFEISYNEEFAMQALAEATEWWDKHIVGDVQPDPISEADVLTLWPDDNSTSITAVPALYEAVKQYNDIRSKIKDLESMANPLREKIILAIGPAECVRYGGRKIASYKTNAAGSRVFRTY